MLKVLRFMFLASILVTPPLVNTKPQRGQNTASCGPVQQALIDYQHAKVGVTRAEVERYFARDGGVQFPQSTRYVYPQCSYLHLDIEFAVVGEEKALFSPLDKVAKVSKIYVDYPAKD